jgi:hypothetical protein
MGPPSYMRSVVVQNVVVRRIPVHEFGAELPYAQNFTNAKRFAVPTYARCLTVPPSGCARSWLLPLTNPAGDRHINLRALPATDRSRQAAFYIFRRFGMSHPRFVRRVVPGVSRGSSEGKWFLQVSGRKYSTSFTAGDPEYWFILGPF